MRGHRTASTAAPMEGELAVTMKRVNSVFGIVFLLLTGSPLSIAGAEAFTSHPRSAEIIHAPPEVEQSSSEPQRPQAQPRPALPTVPLGYEGNEHRWHAPWR